jgi:hypothetical protein
LIEEYLEAKDEVKGYEEGEHQHLQDILEDIGLVDHARPLQGHAHLPHNILALV